MRESKSGEGVLTGKSTAPAAPVSEKPSEEWREARKVEDGVEVVEPEGYSLHSTGINVFDTPKIVEGVVTVVRGIDAMLEMSTRAEKELNDMIVFVPSGTVSYITPILPFVKGVLTVAGAPESHVGILSREFQINCIMTVHRVDLEERYRPGDETQEAPGAYFDQMFTSLNGKYIKMDCRHPRTGMVFVKK